MKRSISINISGMLFNIEEDAYERLKRYLDEIKLYFASYDASGEIVNDIENRIAEIFSTKVSAQKQVITLADVEALITQMGNIKDFAAVEESFEEPRATYEHTTNGNTYNTYGEPKTASRRLHRDESRKVIGGVAAGIAHYLRIDPIWLRILLVTFVAFDVFLTFAISSSALVIGYIILWIALPAHEGLVEEKKIKKLYRNPEDKVIGGVAGGLGAYFGVDSVLIRILFAVGLFTGFGFLAYIILWISMPEARTLTQRMQMQGEPVTLANIEHQVKKNLDVKEGEEESTMVRILLFPFRLLSAIFTLGSAGARSLILFLGTAIRIIVGIALTVGGFFTILGLLLSVGILLGMSPERYVQIYELEVPLALLNNTVPDFLLLAGLLVLTIPALYVMLFGIALLAGRWVLPAPASWTLAGSGEIALIISAAMIPALVLDYKEHDFIDAEARLFKADSSKTLVLRMENGQWSKLRNVDLKIEGSPEGSLRLEQRIIAHGADTDEAQEHAQWASYPVVQKDNILLFGNQLKLPKDKPYYLQHVNATLYIPYGQPFKIDHKMKKMLRGSVLSPWGSHASDIKNNTFIFNKSGEIECITCSAERLEEIEKNRNQSTSAADRTLQYKDFDKIRVGSDYQLTLVQGADYKVEVKGDEEELEAMKVKQQGATLSFLTEELLHGKWLKSRKDRKPAHIFVSVPSLAGLYLSGASRANVALKQEKSLDVELSGAAEMDGTLEVEALQIGMSGSSQVNLQGICKRLAADISGASELMAGALKAAIANIELSGASEADIWVSEKLDADISGGSDLTYRGNPTDSNIDKSAGASAHRKGD